MLPVSGTTSISLIRGLLIGSFNDNAGSDGAGVAVNGAKSLATLRH
jgi:hypothetical protein